MLNKRRPPVKNDLKGISSDDHLRLFIESSLHGVYLIQNDVFQYVNPAFGRIFGYEAKEIVGKLGPMDLTAPEDQKLVAKSICDRIDGKVPEKRYSLHGLKKDGTRVLAEVHGSSVRYRKRPAIIGTIIDNAQLSQAGKSLGEAEERYRRFFNEDIAAHFVTTPEGAVLDCNETFVRLFGFSSNEEAMKINVVSLFPDPRGRNKFLELIREQRLVKRQEAEYVGKDGKKIYVIENAVGEFDGAGNLKSIRGYLIDETKERQLEAQLFEAQKMESIGTLVSGIAHDLNNVLGIILGHVSLMDPEKASRERLIRSREAISKAATRGAHTIRQLLTFARKIETITESVKINDAIEEVLEFLKETFPEKVTFSMHFDPKLPSIHADPNQLQQVLINLFVNARDAMPQGGTITLSTSRVGGNILKGRFTEVGTGEYILVKIADTGVGIDKKNMSRIFEPFFTTKKDGRGTGLGLSVVYGIMKAHHGLIEVQSEAGKGTEFSLYLPIPLQVIETAHSTANEEIKKGHGETILVVEDEELVQEFMKAVLEGNGYGVLLAKDGFEAVGVFGEHRNEVSLVIIDMGLPKMSGAQALSELKMIMPEVKIIFMSGYIEPGIKAEIFNAGIKEFLPKPFSAEDLLGKVQCALKM